jgi:hypothetical protein
MKSKRPPLENLITRLVKQIQIRNPDKPAIGIDQIIELEARWSKFPEKLYQTVKKLEIQERMAWKDLSKIEVRDVEYQIGISLSGESILVKHVIEEKSFYKNRSNPKKSPRKETEQRVLSFISKTQF